MAKLPPAIEGTQAISRAAQVLRQLAVEPHRGQGLTEVATALQLQKPTAHRILRALVQEGLAEQDPITRSYRVGPMVLELSLCCVPSRVASEDAYASLTELARLTGDTCFLITRSGNDAVCLARREGYYPIKAMVLDRGQRRPMGVGAGSVAILAALPPDEAHHLIDQNTPRLVAQAELHGNELRELVSLARQRGYSLKSSRELPSVLSMGIAVKDDRGYPICAISVSTIEQRMRPREKAVAGMLRRVAHDLATHLRSTDLPRALP